MDPDFAAEAAGSEPRRWRALVDEVRAAGDARVCLSNESMARAEPERVRATVQALGGERVEVVAVARRLDKLLPSHWQEQVRAGNTALPFDTWLEVVLGDHRDDDHWRNFWYPHDLEALASRWAEAAGPGRLTFVVLDESDRNGLSRAFERLLELPTGLLAPDAGHRVNASVGRDRVELLRRLNAALADKDWPAEVSEPLRARVARRIRAAEAWPGEAPPVSLMPVWAADRVAELNHERADLMGRLDARVLGDPAALTTPATSDGPDGQVGAGADLVSSELAVDAVLSAMAAAVDVVKQERADTERVIGRLRKRGRKQVGGAPGLDRFSAKELAGELRRRAARKVSRS
jgi:hypothetical protein